MNIRPWLGDVGLAVLLALPTAALASPTAIFWQSRTTVDEPPVHSSAMAAQQALPSRFDIPG